MAFLKKVTDFFGINGVKIVLDVLPEVSRTASAIEGTVTLSAKSEQVVNSIRIVLIEKRTSGKGRNKREQRFELGKLLLNERMTVMAGENKTIAFVLDFVLLKTKNEALKAQGGIFEVIGTIGDALKKEHVEYSIAARAEVSGAALTSSDKKFVRFV